MTLGVKVNKLKTGTDLDLPLQTSLAQKKCKQQNTTYLWYALK